MIDGIPLISLKHTLHICTNMFKKCLVQHWYIYIYIYIYILALGNLNNNLLIIFLCVVIKIAVLLSTVTRDKERVWPPVKVLKWSFFQKVWQINASKGISEDVSCPLLLKKGGVILPLLSSVKISPAH